MGLDLVLPSCMLKIYKQLLIKNLIKVHDTANKQLFMLPYMHE